MAQLTKNTPVIYEADGIAPPQNNLPVKASTEIFLGSAVGILTGFARQLVATDLFGGFCDQHTNNNVAVDGNLNVPVKTRGRIRCAIAALAVTDINKAVAMSDGNTFTLTTAGNTVIGRVIRWESTGIGIVAFDILAQAAS